MHFLFSSVGTNGDVLPLLAIAQEMKSRGHGATLVAGYGYAEVAALMGVAYVPLSTRQEHEHVLRDKATLSTRYGFLFIARHSVRWNQIILETIEEHAAPDLFVLSSERLNLWGDLVARKLFSARTVRAKIDLPVLEHLAGATLPAGRVQRALSARVDSNWANYLAGRGMHVGRNHVARIRRSVRPSVPTIALWPDWIVNREQLQGVKQAFGFMPVPRPPTKDYSLKAPRRGHLVFVAGTEGTTKDWLLYFTETSASICRALGREGVLVGGTGKSNESRPDSGLTSVAFRPLNEVLAGAVAIVHHGGIGTAAAALEHGVPQIALPRVFMQPMNAEWISRLGVCSVVNPRAWTVCNGVRLLKEMIGNEEVTRRAQEIAHRIDRRAALMNVCRFLEEPANYF